MPPDGLEPQDDLTLIDALIEILTASPNVEMTLPAAVERLLAAYNRRGALLALDPPGSHGAASILYVDLPPAWLEMVPDRGSPLIRLAEAALAGDAFDAYEGSVPDLAGVVPINTSALQVGVLVVHGAPLTDWERRGIQALTRYIGSTTRLGQWYAAAHDQRLELAKLNRLSEVLSAQPDLDEILATLSEGLLQLLRVQGAAVLLLDFESVWKKDLSDPPEMWSVVYHPQSDAGLLGEVARTRRAVIVPDVTAEPRYLPATDGVGGLAVRNVVCVPLVARDQRLGALLVANKEGGGFDDGDLELLTSLAALVANAYYTARLINRLKEASGEVEASRVEIQQSRRTLLALFDGIPNPLYIVDGEYTLIALNKTAARTDRVRAGEAAKREPKDLVGRRCYQVLYRRKEPCEGCRVAETLRSGASQHRELRQVIEGEKPRNWEVDTYPIRNDRGEAVQVIVAEVDVTQRRELERSLEQSKQLAAIGEFAALFVHQVRNPLVAVVANAQLLMRELRDEDQKGMASDIAEAGMMASRVLEDVMNFARKDDFVNEPYDVNATVRKAVNVIEASLRDLPITIDCDLAADLPEMFGDGQHLIDVWQNLLANARDAFEGAAGSVSVHTRLAGEVVQVHVRDTGPGIAEDKLVKIFQPFFTTKKRGKGTGLGLAFVRRIVEAHRGRITVASTVGQGTTFTVVLPINGHSS
ncbi:MAG: GAF domain-containing protein [Anaerolineales bacterium]|nr:GAF domain-containing protein [Anaerolineales bacterium]